MKKVARIITSIIFTTISLLGVEVEQTKPKVISQPVAQATAVGKGTELSVLASGGGIYYQWQVKNGKVWEDVSGATSSTLAFENLKAEDNNKEYRCFLKNDISTATSKTAKLVVISTPLPVIDTKKHVPEVAIITGKKNKATFAIKATKPKGETGTYKYQWYKNGEPIAKATKATYTTDVLTEADFEQDPADKIYYTKDSYYCVISVDVKKQIINEAKTDSFKVMKLEPAKILVNPVDVLVSDKEDAIFTVEATKTSGVKAVYQWQVCAFGSDPENPKNWKNAGKGATLTLKKATVKLSGNLYRCQVYNDLNKKDPDTSAYAKLEVKGTPIIKTQPKAITVYEGKGSSMVVLAQGYNLTYQWYVSDTGKKDSWTILSGETSSTLSIKGDSTKFYQCKVWSKDSPDKVVVSKSAKTTVKAGVQINGYTVSQYSTILEDVGTNEFEVYEDFSLELRVYATGDKPNYQWYCSDDGETFTAIAGATKDTLLVDPVFMQDKIYYCEVFNGTTKLNYTDGTNVKTNDIYLYVKQSMLPKSLVGLGVAATYTEYESVSTFMVFQDTRYFRMTVSSAPYVPFEKTMYLYNRISPFEAEMSLSFMDMYNGRKTLMNFKGYLYYDEEINGVVAILVDEGKDVFLSFIVDRFIASEYMWQTLPLNSVITFQGIDKYSQSIKILSPKVCLYTGPTGSFECSYTYVKKSGTLGIITLITNSDKWELNLLYDSPEGGEYLDYLTRYNEAINSEYGTFTIKR